MKLGCTIIKPDLKLFISNDSNRKKNVMRMATLLSSPFEQWHFTSQTGHQSQTFWAQVGRYYKMWEKTQRSLWLAPKRDDLIDFYECHTKGHNELARLSSDGGSAFLCSKLQIHFILQIKRLSQKRVKSESKTTNSSRRFLVMGCISFVKYIQRICLALNTKIITFMFFNLIKKGNVNIVYNSTLTTKV